MSILFYAGSSYGYNSAVYSESWSLGSIAPASQWTSAAWSPTLDMFCIGAAHNPTFPELTKVATSTNGTTWIQQDHGPTYPNIYDLIWIEELGMFLTCGQNGSIMSSLNGVDWIWESGGAEFDDVDDLTGICYSPALNLIVAVGWNNIHAVITSPDAKTWTSYATPGATYVWNDVCWSPALGLFCAVANWAGAGTERMMTSPDGINWTIRSADSASQFRCIDWSPELGIFVAAGGNVINTSPDGINWTAQNGVGGTNYFKCEWVSALGQFFLVNGVSTDIISNSPDGVNWNHVALTSNGYSRYGMAYSPPLNKLVVVAANLETDNIETSDGS